MKKIVGMVLALSLLVALAGCNMKGSVLDETPVPVPESTTTQSKVRRVAEQSSQLETPAEPEWVDDRYQRYKDNPRANTEEWIEGVEDASEFLTPEQYGQFLLARRAYRGFSMSGGDLGFAIEPWDDGIGNDYYRMGGTCDMWEDFYTQITSIFTPEYFEEICGDMYVEIDGYAYCRLGDRGGNITHLYTTYALENATDTRIEFYILGHYYTDYEAFDEQWDSETGYTGEVRQEAYPVVMELRDGVWLTAAIDTEV